MPSRARIASQAALLCFLASVLPAKGPSLGPNALEPPTTGGLEAVDRSLAKLATTARLLVIGAHPDDEDTALLTRVARGMGGEAAYLALSRGEGGQNLIGSELGPALGVLRTQELLAARRIDGARQFFTRAYDFGYTRSLEEALQRWPQQILLEDAVRVVRRFRPQVIVTMFSPEIGGHGQHLAAGWVAEEVFAAAGDAARFPAVGSAAWKPEALYRRTFFDPERATFEMSQDAIEPLSGRSMVQIAMASRSRHRSQDMGMLQPLGVWPAGFEWVAGGVGAGAQSLFAGVDTSLTALGADLAPQVASEVVPLLERVERRAIETRRALSPVGLGSVAPVLAQIVGDLRRAEARLPAGATRDLVSEKIAVAEVGLAAAASVAIDAVASRRAVAPGQESEVEVSLWNAGDEPVELLGAEVRGRPGWSVTAADPPTTQEHGVVTWRFIARPEDAARPTVPYYLERPRIGDLYDWSDVPETLRGEPERGPELVAHLRLVICGTEIELDREVVWRRRDQALGEIRAPLRIVPRLEIAVESALVPWRRDSADERSLNISLKSNADSEISGRVVVEAPPGWLATESEFAITEPGGGAEVEVRIRPQERPTTGRSRFRLAAELDSGERLAGAVALVDYPHVQPRAVPSTAEVELSVIDLSLPDVGTVGYVDGAADGVPRLLTAAGLSVERLDGVALERTDLASYGVIVIGSRAYEVDPALGRINARLLDWVRAGGTLIVQYQQYDYFRGGFAPYRLDIARRHDRITDENSPVEILQPDHAVFRQPNLLSAADWEGWVQERGLYFASSWDEAFTPLVAMRDPGSEEQRGGLLVARLGEGHYVYTGLAFFRQLPAGVPGAYRLLANLIALD